MKPKVVVEIKTVYGNERIYPVSDNAKLFAQLVRKKTLDLADIAIIESLGYEIEVQQTGLRRKE